MNCSHCGSSDLVGPFEMDGIVDGTYQRSGEWWTVCRACHKSDHRGQLQWLNPPPMPDWLVAQLDARELAHRRAERVEQPTP